MPSGVAFTSRSQSAASSGSSRHSRVSIFQPAVFSGWRQQIVSAAPERRSARLTAEAAPPLPSTSTRFPDAVKGSDLTKPSPSVL